MKLLLITTVFSVIGLCLNAQSVSPAETLAVRIAQKIKDSLSLTELQKQSIYGVNINLHANKLAVRQQFQHPDSLTRHIQLVENTRDTLYSTILTSSQYTLYKQKKRKLVSNN